MEARRFARKGVCEIKFSVLIGELEGRLGVV